jgi:molecular chaperone DnaK (HSP70)
VRNPKEFFIKKKRKNGRKGEDRKLQKRLWFFGFLRA